MIMYNLHYHAFVIYTEEFLYYKLNTWCRNNVLFLDDINWHNPFLAIVEDLISIPPPQVQALCSVVVWYSPEVSCGDITGYDVRFFSPQLDSQNVTKRVGANRTFYIVQDEDVKMSAKQEDIHVQVILSLVIYGVL